MKKVKKIFLVFLVIVFVFLSFNNVNAALVNCGRSGSDPCTINDLFAFGSSNSDNPFWINLIQTALGISGIIILCIFIYSGINLMFSGGKPEKIDRSKKMMVGSFLGILLVFFSFTLVKAGLMVLVGDKWSIYFGNSQVSSSSSGSSQSNSSTQTGVCSDNSSCRTTEYCCFNNRYDASNNRCSGSSGSCITKKKEFLLCKENSECRNNDCYSGYCFKKVDPSIKLKKVSDPSVDIANGDPCHSVSGSYQGKCMYISSDSLSIFNGSGLNLSSSECATNRTTDSGAVALVCIKQANYK